MTEEHTRPAEARSRRDCGPGQCYARAVPRRRDRAPAVDRFLGLRGGITASQDGDGLPLDQNDKPQPHDERRKDAQNERHDGHRREIHVCDPFHAHPHAQGRKEHKPPGAILASTAGSDRSRT